MTNDQWPNDLKTNDQKPFILFCSILSIKNEFFFHIPVRIPPLKTCFVARNGTVFQSMCVLRCILLTFSLPPYHALPHRGSVSNSFPLGTFFPSWMYANFTAAGTNSTVSLFGNSSRENANGWNMPRNARKTITGPGCGCVFCVQRGRWRASVCALWPLLRARYILLRYFWAGTGKVFFGKAFPLGNRFTLDVAVVWPNWSKEGFQSNMATCISWNLSSTCGR